MQDESGKAARVTGRKAQEAGSVVADKAQDAGGVLADKAQEVGGKAADKAGDLAVSAKEKGKELGSKAADKAGEVVHAVATRQPQLFAETMPWRVFQDMCKQLGSNAAIRDGQSVYFCCAYTLQRQRTSWAFLLCFTAFTQLGTALWPAMQERTQAWQ